MVRPRVTVVKFCEYCNTMLYLDSQKARRRFCNNSCSAKYKGKKLKGKTFQLKERTIKFCVYCGDGFSVLPSRKLIKYCSQQCYWTHKTETFTGKNSHRWRGGHSKYRGPNWDEQRRLALQRDKKKCRKCNIDAVHVHHIIRFDDFTCYKEANKLSNLLTLCSSCHKATNGIEWHYSRWVQIGCTHEEIKRRTLEWL